MTDTHLSDPIKSQMSYDLRVEYYNRTTNRRGDPDEPHWTWGYCENLTNEGFAPENWNDIDDGLWRRELIEVTCMACLVEWKRRQGMTDDQVEEHIRGQLLDPYPELDGF